LGYPPIVAPETLKEWKVAITSVRQGYKSMEECQDYKTGRVVTTSRMGNQSASIATSTGI